MKCVLCSSDSIFPLEFSKPSKRVFLRCPHCDLIFVPESHHLQPDEELARYRLHRNTLSNDGYDPFFFPAFPEGSYDLVISTEVFEHLREIRVELQRIRKLIKSGGYLAVMTSMHDVVNDFENWWYKNDPTHICFFDAHTFEWLAKEFGFEIVYNDNKNFIILNKK